MAKNRVAPDRHNKKRDSFFTKPQQNKSNKADKYRKKFGLRKGETDTQYSRGEDSFRPSVSGSDDFFVKSIDNTLTGGSSAKNLQSQDTLPSRERFKSNKIAKHKNENDAQRFRASASGGDEFFVKSIDNATFKQGKKSFLKSHPHKLTTKSTESQDAVKPEKKPFDKKRYRLKKYSKKYKLEQWEQKRKTAILRGYYHSVHDDEQKFDVKTIYEQYKNESDSEADHVENKIDEENENNLNASISQASALEDKPVASRGSKDKKNKAFRKAQLEFQRIREEKQKKREEMLKRKAEREEALQAYKKKKAEKFKKLNRKTKRGQPIMKERIEMLLEKIQNSMK